MTAAPVALFIAIDHGARFASHVADGFVAGMLGQIAFVLAYVWTSARGVSLVSALAAGAVAFVVAGLALGLPQFPLAIVAPVVFLALSASLSWNAYLLWIYFDLRGKIGRYAAPQT